MRREKLFAISIFLRGIYYVSFFFEMLSGLSYVFRFDPKYWIIIRSTDTLTQILFVISAFRLRQEFAGGKYTAFVILNLIGLIFQSLSSIATIVPIPYLNDTRFWNYYGGYDIEKYLHLIYIGNAIFCYLLYFVAWILFEKYITQKEGKKIARLSKFIHFSFFLVIVGLGIILSKDFLYYDGSFPQSFNSLEYLINHFKIKFIYDFIYLGGVLVSIFGLLICILTSLLMALRLLIHQVTPNDDFRMVIEHGSKG